MARGCSRAEAIKEMAQVARERSFDASSRMALAVTSTVAPVSAKIAGQRPVKPMMVVTKIPP
jgi:hypothetical protein